MNVFGSMKKVSYVYQEVVMGQTPSTSTFAILNEHRRLEAGASHEVVVEFCSMNPYV